MSNRKLKEKIREQEEKIKRLECGNRRLEELGRTNAKLKSDLASLRSELTIAKKKIREQTEADLFFVSAKIQKELLEGKTKEEVRPLYEQQGRLYQEWLAQGQQQMGSPLLSGLLGRGLGQGFFGAFGR